MSLRLKINLIVGVLMLLFVASVIHLQIDSMRESVHEEVVAANRVAGQILNRTASLYAKDGTPAMLGFLGGLGRVRSNDIELIDSAGRVLYRSPVSAYKTGRDAPAWFARLISPRPAEQTFEFDGGKLVVRSNASRATLDAWDGIVKLALIGLALFVLLNALVFWLVGQTLRPFPRIVAALNRLEAGQFDTSLPKLDGKEANAIGTAFNRMVQMLRTHVETEQRAARAERELSDSRDLARWIDRHIEQERRMIARELHDELGQSVTAIRSMALSVAQRTHDHDAQASQAAQTIADEASRLYEAMHGLIPRLTPLVLDRFGLPDALEDLVARTHRAHADVQIDLTVALGDMQLSNEAALALYRAAQEGITNALRHGQAKHIRLELTHDAGGLQFALQDDGQGFRDDPTDRDGRYGLNWLAERVEAVGGRLTVEAAQPNGVRMGIELPQEVA